MMMFEYLPYPKSKQLFENQKEKDKPKYKEMRYNRKRKQSGKSDNPLKSPSRHSRGQFSMEDKQKIDEIYGHACVVCGNVFVEYHHCKFLSGLGRGTWRNGIPLCYEHHRTGSNSPHQNENIAQQYRQHKLKIFGPYYYMDAWDLFKRGLITNMTKESFENFMKEEQDRAARDFSQKEDA